MGRWVSVLTVALICGSGGKTWAASEASLAAVLSAQPSATGASLWARVRACGIQIEPGQSHIDRIFSDSVPADLKAGDLAVELWVRMPSPVQGEIALLWTVRQGKAIPQSGWAERIQKTLHIEELHC